MKHLKFRNFLFPLILIIMLALTACASDTDSSGGMALDTPFTLGIGETVNLSDADLNITFAEVVEDSRCPTDVQCVQAGRAIVRLVIEPTGESKQTVEVMVASLEGAAAGGFVIEALDLSPIPTLANPVNTSQYVVELVVSAAP